MREPSWSTRPLRPRAYREGMLHLVALVAFAIVYAIGTGRPLAFAWRAALVYAAFASVFSLARRRRLAGRTVGRKTELRVSSTVAVAATVAILALIGGLASAVRRHPSPMTGPLLLVFGGLAAVIVVDTLRWRFRVDERGIEARRGWLGSITTVHWSSITALESYVRIQKGFSHPMIRVIAPHETLEIHCSLDGVGDLAQLAIDHVAPEVLERCPEAREVLRSLAAERAMHPTARRRI